LPLNTVGLSPASFICNKAIQKRAHRRLVVLLKYLFVPEIIHRGTPEVFLHQESGKVAI
jgi:hypothetical protein